jgi:hypothetical protein
MWGRSQCKRGSPDLPEFAAWRRQIFVHVTVLIQYLFNIIKKFVDFSYLYRNSNHQTLFL